MAGNVLQKSLSYDVGSRPPVHRRHSRPVPVRSSPGLQLCGGSERIGDEHVGPKGAAYQRKHVTVSVTISRGWKRQFALVLHGTVRVVVLGISSCMF